MSIDIMPTILDFLGRKPRDGYIQGLSLLPLIKRSEKRLFEERACYSENLVKPRDFPESGDHYVSMIRNNYKYIYDYLREEKKELYNINIDPHEKTDLFLMKKEIAMKMEAEIHQWLKVQNKIHDDILLPREPIRVDEKTREQLKSLGYVK
jgi:arylsulfatase A-like enzyme